MVHFGKENPFIQGKVRSIVWEEIKPEDFPSNAIRIKDLGKGFIIKENEYFAVNACKNMSQMDCNILYRICIILHKLYKILRKFQRRLVIGHLLKGYL